MTSEDHRFFAARRRASCAAIVVAAALAGCSHPAPLVTVPEHPNPTIVFTNTSVADVAAGAAVPNQDVVVVSGVIAEIGASGTLSLPDGAQHIDGRGATLVPGLIDSHGHVANSPAPPWTTVFPDADRNLQAFLYCGVTTVLDPADLEPDAFERRDAVATGKTLGPTLYVSGPMLTAVGGHPIPVLDVLAPWWIRWYLKRHMTRPLASESDVHAAIDFLAANHADVVKIAIDAIPAEAPHLSGELASAVVRDAHAKGLRVVAHVGSLADALEAGNAGVDAFMHMVYQEPLDQASAARIAAFRKPVVPTMGVFESYALVGRGPRVATPLERETADAEMLASFDKIPAGAISPAFQSFFDKLFQNHMAWRQSVRLMRDNGVTILAGSDAQSGVFPGAGLHRELALLVESGMTPAQVLRAATLDAARFLEQSGDPLFGSIAKGKRADLVLVDGDPLSDISSLARIRVVMKKGVILDRHPVSTAS